MCISQEKFILKRHLGRLTLKVCEEKLDKEINAEKAEKISKEEL